MANLALILALSSLAAIGSNFSDTNAVGNLDGSVTGSLAVAGERVNTDIPQVAKNGPKQTESEIDRFWLETAATACENGEFKSFFEAFVRSVAVRNRHMADPIAILANRKSIKLALARYVDFPIAMADYTFVSKASEHAGPNKQEYLHLTFNQSQSSRYRVDWVRIRYAGNGNDADGEAEIAGTYGKPGFLIFEPTQTCWRLIEDNVHDGPYPGDLVGN
jgi:hypothetical protein